MSGGGRGDTEVERQRKMDTERDTVRERDRERPVPGGR